MPCSCGRARASLANKGNLQDVNIKIRRSGSGDLCFYPRKLTGCISQRSDLVDTRLLHLQIDRKTVQRFV